MTPTGELIAGIGGSSYVALQPASDIREALLANLGPGESIQFTCRCHTVTPL